MDQLFVTGMFRSGTTLLARMIHSHDEIVCASDPYRPFFNCLRDSVAGEIGVSVPSYAPLGSYFCDDDQRRLFEAVQQCSLDRPFDRDADELLTRIRSHGRQFSPRIINNLRAVEGDSFEAVYRNLLSKVPEQYGTGNERVTATKEVWSTEFVPALAETFPECKFVLVVRDPRAVAASNNVNQGRRYPWTFLARQWRKIAILSWVYDTDEELCDRVHVLRYEDLVESPRETATDMCEFLDLPLDEDILDPSNFVDGRGEQWLQNTSYDDGGASFNTESIDKWQDTLDDRTISFLEQCCYPAMTRFGYEFSSSCRFGLTDELLLDPPVVKPEEMADWIRSYYPNRSVLSVQSELGTEYVRQRMLLCDDEIHDTFDPETIRSYFLNQQYFDAIRRTLHA